MNNQQKMSLEHVQAFLEASQEMRFQAKDRRERYQFVERTLREHGYGGLKRGDRGLVRRYIGRMTGLSRAQMTRLVGCYQGGSAVQPQAYRRHRFAQRYTAADIALLAEVDEAHQSLSGPATQKIL